MAKKITLIDAKGQRRDVGTVEFLKEPVTTDTDLKCSGKRITVDQANKILGQMKPTDKHGGAVLGTVGDLDRIEWRT
jgi:hypothetical protein